MRAQLERKWGRARYNVRSEQKTWQAPFAEKRGRGDRGSGGRGRGRGNYLVKSG